MNPAIGLPGVPSVGDAVTEVINTIAEAVWGFTNDVLTAAFTIIDGHAQPTLLYTKAGPLGAVYPITLWIGIVLALCLGFAQAGRVAWAGGEGIGAALKGLGMYALVTAGGLTVINLMAKAGASIADGIIQAGFDVDNFQGLSDNSTFMAGAVKSLSGMSLALMSLFLVIPFAIGLIVEVLIREGSLLVLAATYPIICAGLVHEKFARWYWTGVRWLLALICMTPVIAIAMVIGHSMAVGAGSGKGDDALSAIGVAMVSGVVCILSLTAPLVLFKLFAFVDPNTASGQSARGFFGGSGAGGTGTAAMGATGSSGSDGGSGDGSDGSSQDDDGADGGAGARASSEVSSTQAGVMGAFGPAGAVAGSVAGGAVDGSNSAASHAADSLDSIGAGHRGGPSGGGDDEDDDSQQRDRQDDSGDQPDDTSGQGPSQGPAPDAQDPGGAPTVDLDKANPTERTPLGGDPPDAAGGGGPSSGDGPGGGSSKGGGGKPPGGPGGSSGGSAGTGEAVAV